MSDTKSSEVESTESAAGRKGTGPQKKQPSFDEVMQQALAPKPPPPEPKAAPRSAPPPPQKSAQPTFDEIMQKVAVPDDGTVHAQQPERREAAKRPPRAKDERKMPIVVRKPRLGETPAEAQAAQDAQDAAREAPAGEQREKPAQKPRQRTEPQPLAESAFAQPNAEEESADFGAMFAEAQKTQGKQGKLKPGQRLSARVAHLGAEVAFLDLGGKGEAIIDLRELRNDKGEMLVHVGETIDGYVLSLADGSVVLTRSVPKGAGREALSQALDGKVPVEGTVTAHNKGGLEVDLGGTRAFCPASQVDVRFHDDLGVFVGQKLRFRVTEIRGGNAILSRRALIEEERAVQGAELRKKLEVGAQLDGTVVGVRDFGAFVDLGGLEGLIHVSELSHQRVAHAQDAVKTGQKVRVQVLRIEKDEKGVERIALSLRALEQDPWDAARQELEEGKKLQGKVVRLQPFGAFVELFPGVDGLVHVSALSDRHVSHPREVVKEGEQIWVQIESIDDAQRRVSLRKITEEEAQQPGRVEPKGRSERGERPERGEGKPAAKRFKVGDMVDAEVDRIEVYGVFVKWDGGKGLVPNPELGTPRGTDNKKAFPMGTKMKVQIIELDEKGRYRLSKTSAERDADRVDYEQYKKSVPKAGKGFGTLGDLLRARLQPQDDE